LRQPAVQPHPISPTVPEPYLGARGDANGASTDADTCTAHTDATDARTDLNTHADD
jgi:hypothetical protein